MKKQFLLFLTLSLLVASPVLAGHAIPTSGDYLAYCQESIKVYEGKSADKSKADVCLGFVEGAISMHFVLTATDRATPYYCMSEYGIDSLDSIPIWIEYLENNPQKLKNAPIITFLLAISEVCPCTEHKTGK